MEFSKTFLPDHFMNNSVPDFNFKVFNGIFAAMYPFVRHLYFLCVTCCWVTAGVYAQRPASPFADEYRNFWGGIAAGVNFSQVDGDGFAGYNKVGLNAGPVVYARFSPLIGASLEIAFSQKGSKMRRITDNAYSGPAVERYDMKLNYAEVPLLLHLMPEGRFHYSLGASYGYLISSEETAETIAPVNLDSELYSFLDQDINMIFGASYQLYGNWFFSGRFAYSLSTIRDPARVPVGYGGGNQANNLFTFRLVYLF